MKISKIFSKFILSIYGFSFLISLYSFSILSMADNKEEIFIENKKTVLNRIKELENSEDFLCFKMCPSDIKYSILDASRVSGVSYKIIYNIAAIESNLGKYKISKKNSNGTYDIGVMGLNSAYIKYFADEIYKKDFDPKNKGENIMVGALYLKHIMVKYSFDLETALIAYNCGPSRVLKNNIPNSSKKYASRIINSIIEL